AVGPAVGVVAPDPLLCTRPVPAAVAAEDTLDPGRVLACVAVGVAVVPNPSSPLTSQYPTTPHFRQKLPPSTVLHATAGCAGWGTGLEETPHALSTPL